MALRIGNVQKRQIYRKQIRSCQGLGVRTALAAPRQRAQGIF